MEGAEGVGTRLPDVAVVGISNWELDAAKMNRSITLGRPPPTEADLIDTALAIYGAAEEGGAIQGSTENHLKRLARGYFAYYRDQPLADFHGLRDYYSLIKEVAVAPEISSGLVRHALERNFGGLPPDGPAADALRRHFLPGASASDASAREPVVDLIRGNIADLVGRHLLILTTGSAAVDLLRHAVGPDRPVHVLLGSTFPGDCCESYNYRVLSEIILRMEGGGLLILKDLASVYGALYDMLNQSYSVVGGRRNVRVALGAYSNPMCYVADSFRAVVLMDPRAVVHADPPFLNRFEKQRLSCADSLRPEHAATLARLHRFVLEFCTPKPGALAAAAAHFRPSDTFLGLHDETLPSLVLFHSAAMEAEAASAPDHAAEPPPLFERCIESLLAIVPLDGLLRARCCLPGAERALGVGWEESFFSQHRTSLRDYLGARLRQGTVGAGLRLWLMSYSNIHTDVCALLHGASVAADGRGDGAASLFRRVVAYKLGSFTSVNDLRVAVKQFFALSPEDGRSEGDDGPGDLLLLQCDAARDGRHLLIARHTLEQEAGEARDPRKHVALIVHVARETFQGDDVSWPTCFLSNWEQKTIDTLEGEEGAGGVPLARLLSSGTAVASAALDEMLPRLTMRALMYMRWPLNDVARVRGLAAALQEPRNAPVLRALRVAAEHTLEKAAPIQGDGDRWPVSLWSFMTDD